MEEAELLAALDVHDRLLSRCALGEMTYPQFEAEYDNFYERWALDGHESDPAGQAKLAQHADRIRVHRRVWEEVLVRATSEELARYPQAQHAGFWPPPKPSFTFDRSPWMLASSEVELANPPLQSD